jgi:hypothetical protein
MSVVISVLAKDKAHILPIFLDCLLKQDYPKDKIHLYIRTNDNNDSTATVLKGFVDIHGASYRSVFYDDSDIQPLIKCFGQHEWNIMRFKILGKIRQDSIDYAMKLGADYFVVDCDNLITPFTLSRMVALRQFKVISPMLESRTAYSNYHYSVDANGYLKEDDFYHKTLKREICGIIQVAVVHCTYYIENSVLKEIVYDDNSCRYEYVIFSDTLRKKGIPQSIDNRFQYGFISFAESIEDVTVDYSTFLKLNQCLPV